jgi:hypothetical protein
MFLIVGFLRNKARIGYHSLKVIGLAKIRWTKMIFSFV